ncbi:MAG: dipeptidase [Clostridia bacterium]|nr:dipeptidase [Clostridia bacterium]
MLFDLHCDSLSAFFPLLSPHIFSKNESKILAIFCEDLPPNLRAESMEQQYRTYENSLLDGTLTPYPNQGKKRVILGMEGASGIRDKSALALWKQRGLKTLSLCWKTNRLATGWEGETDVGVSAEGFAFLSEMERLKIVGDVSHLSTRSALQTAEKVEKVMATHSPFYEVFPHKRNLPKAVADALYDKGGIVGITPYPPFLGSDMQALLSHAEYGLKRYGNRFLAIGTDTDGTKGVFCKELNASLPILPQLFSALKERFGKRVAYRVCYENAAEFFSDVF